MKAYRENPHTTIIVIYTEIAITTVEINHNVGLSMLYNIYQNALSGLNINLNIRVTSSYVLFWSAFSSPNNLNCTD